MDGWMIGNRDGYILIRLIDGWMHGWMYEVVVLWYSMDGINGFKIICPA